MIFIGCGLKSEEIYEKVRLDVDVTGCRCVRVYDGGL